MIDSYYKIENHELSGKLIACWHEEEKGESRVKREYFLLDRTISHGCSIKLVFQQFDECYDYDNIQYQTESDVCFCNRV